MALNPRSTGESGSVAQRRRQEEKNQLILRELLALPPNRHCFECGQRGPTYANVTHGSFCCMHCSGLLRGLNPPQRVKSITMATFTEDDLEKLRRVGNEHNRVVWLGLYEGGNGVQLERKSQDEKYEQRRWYVSPDELTEQKRLLDEYSSGKRSESNASPSILSHQSNQSAPANLSGAAGGSGRAGLLDLLTGDLNELFAPTATSGITTTPVAATTATPPRTTMASTYGQVTAPVLDSSIFSPPQAGAGLSPSTDPFSSSHSRVQPITQQFSNIPHSSTIAFGTFPNQPSHRASSGHPAADFANFETQFNAMVNLGGERANQPAKNTEITQSASAFALGHHRPPAPPLPQANPVVHWPGQTAPPRNNAATGPPQAVQCGNKGNFGRIGSTSNGGADAKVEKPDGHESVDYSALEELYRDASSGEKSSGFSSSTGPVPQPPQITLSNLPAETNFELGGTSFEDNFAKSNFGTANNWGWTPSSTTSASETTAGFGIPNPPAAQPHPTNNGQGSNWNPFA